MNPESHNFQISLSSFKLKYSLCGPELQSKLINNTIYCEIHYDSLIYPLTHSSDLNQADQEIVLGVNTDSVTLSFPSSKINQYFVTMILKYGEDELSVKIPVQTLVSGCRHHHYLIDMDSTTESKIELDFVIKALDISQFAIRFEFLLQNMNDKDYYIIYTIQNQNFSTYLDKTKQPTRKILCQPPNQYSLLLLDSSLSLSLVYIENGRPIPVSKATIPFTTMLLESSIPPAVHSFPGTEFKFSITVSLDLTLPLYYQLENGVIDQHGVILDRTNLDYHHLLQSETFIEGQDMNPSMENMILPPEDSVPPPEDSVPPPDKFDFSFENLDIPKFSIESQDGVDEPKDSMPNTSEVVPQEEPEVPLEEEAMADINSDVIEYINNILKEDLLSEPGSPLPNLDSEPNIFFCKTISDTTELLPATCYLQFKEKTIEIFIMKSSMKIVLLSLSSFSLCQLSYADSILTIDFNYHALYAHRITLNLKDAEEAIVNQLISSISCLSQLTYQLVENVSPYFIKLYHHQNKNEYYMNRFTNTLYSSLPTAAYYSVTFPSIIFNYLCFNPSLSSSSILPFTGVQQSFIVKSLSMNGQTYRETISIGDVLISFQCTNSQTVYHTNKLPYTFIVKLLKDEANYPLVCTFKNPYV